MKASVRTRSRTRSRALDKTEAPLNYSVGRLLNLTGDIIVGNAVSENESEPTCEERFEPFDLFCITVWTQPLIR